MFLFELFDNYTTNNNPAMMTWDDYWKMMNPNNKFHSDEAYDYTLDELNNYNSLLHGKIVIGSYNDNYKLSLVNFSKYSYITIFDTNDNIIGWFEDDTLYIQKHGGISLNNVKRSIATEEDINVNDIKVQYIKYVKDHFYNLIKKKHIDNYPNVVQHIKKDGEQLTIRSDNERIPAYIILNSQGLKVAGASDEWGAILVYVAKEYRGKGLGQILGRIFRDDNPTKNTGGTTYNGSKQVRKIWEKYVSDALQHGKYSEWVKQNILSKEKVKSILKDFNGSQQTDKFKELTTQSKKNDAKDWLLMSNDDVSFVIYDKHIYEDDNKDLSNISQYIVGFCLIRDYEENDFIYNINYNNLKAAQLLVWAALTYYKTLHINTTYADFIDNIDNMKYVDISNNTMNLTQDIPLIKDMVKFEKLYRKKYDSYDEYFYSIIEAAEYKWD